MSTSVWRECVCLYIVFTLYIHIFKGSHWSYLLSHFVCNTPLQTFSPLFPTFIKRRVMSLTQQVLKSCLLDAWLDRLNRWHLLLERHLGNAQAPLDPLMMDWQARTSPTCAWRKLLELIYTISPLSKCWSFSSSHLRLVTAHLLSWILSLCGI